MNRDLGTTREVSSHKDEFSASMQVQCGGYLQLFPRLRPLVSDNITSPASKWTPTKSRAFSRPVQSLGKHAMRAGRRKGSVLSMAAPASTGPMIKASAATGVRS